jgi:hypothetical protein
VSDDRAEPGTWLAGQQSGFESLLGRSVSGWRGVEMAFREDGPEGPRFTDSTLPFLQLRELTLLLSREVHRTVRTYQDDDNFGLSITDAVEVDRRTWDGIFRHGELDLPVGPVTLVDVRFDDATLAEVSFVIGGSPLLLIAGEVYENYDDTLEVHRFDESVLAFTDQEVARSINWIPSRNRQ